METTAAEMLRRMINERDAGKLLCCCFHCVVVVVLSGQLVWLLSLLSRLEHRNSFCPSSPKIRLKF